ncbi:hypothetical protein LEP1GSC188_2838 [Leptospira weilii serovar Topaz str. LT2116]|uniref:Uncharacterized protein n=1 Tax=Leptospira weilii serovar Topaz str. LT2116 TaxID=1088540 RepID=M3EPI8_9LEPT|nr:hypothetical protein LEP1GSC188_2838 [Leptospira weilii serovar Topaz str. LT2116]
MNFVNLFSKCGNYNKSQFYKQILKVGNSTFRKFFPIFNRRTHVKILNLQN